MFRALLLGTLLSLGIWFGAIGSGIAVTVMSPISTYDISLLVSAANVLAPFIGAFTAGWIAGRRGFVYGAWVGGLYTFISVLLAALVFADPFLFSLPHLALNFFLGCVGGVSGVNTRLYTLRSNKKLRNAGL
jgi:putative membrane protein (TIGR04086 family)